jgi:integrase
MKKKLTELAVQKLKPTPGKAQEYYFDQSLTGLCLCVGAKRKTWYAVYYQDGKTKYHKLGHYPILNRDQAGKAARKFLGDPQAALKKEATKETFKEVAEAFLAQHVAKLRSKNEYQRIITKYLVPSLGPRSFTDLKRSDCVRVLNKIENDHGVRQRDMVLAILRKMMSWYEEEGADDDYISPIARKVKARLSTSATARKRILDDAEIKAVWNACNDLGTFGAFIKVALLTAQREAKVATMLWTDISDGTWTIRKEDREKGHAEKLRLPPMVIEIIDQQPRYADNPYVFPAERNGGPLRSMDHHKKKLDAKLPGMTPWVIHDLRRTARSLLSELVQPHIAERVLGHVQQGVAGVYDRYSYTTEKAQALQALANKVHSILHPEDADSNVAQFPGGAALREQAAR